MTKVKFLNKIIILFLLFPFFAFAVGPIESFDTYSTGDLQANSGGTGWSENWGATVACDTTWDVSTTNPHTGANNALGTAGTCARNFTAISTEDERYTFFFRASQTTGDMHIRYVTGGAGGTHIIRLLARDTGQLQATNNTTNENLGAYSADTWYRWDNLVNSFGSKTFQSGFCDDTASPGCVPSLSTDKTFFNNDAASDFSSFYFNINAAGTYQIDSLGTPATAAADDIRYESGSFFQLLWNTIIQKVYT